jgi:hypothetical protein
LIPNNVEILGSSCFSKCKSLSLITFESNSHLTRIKSNTFSYSSSSLQSILIPNNVVILGLSCFSYCNSLSSITFESNSHLTRIESDAFSYSSSSLQSIVIPRNVRFIDGSAFIDLTLSSISIESGNDIFAIENDFLVDILHHKLIQNLQKPSTIEIPNRVEILGSSCFSYCESLSSIIFESNSHLIRIESEAFSDSSLESILISNNVEILVSKCCYTRQSLSLITFESNSHLTHIQSFALSGRSIVIPSKILFVASDALNAV